MSVQLTPRELETMTILWEHGSATVAELRERLEVESPYTTVLSLLRAMHAKGLVRHESEGRAHRYFPRIRKDAVHRTAMSRLVETVFNGSAELALTQLVTDRRLTQDDLRRIRDLIDQRLPTEDR